MVIQIITAGQTSFELRQLPCLEIIIEILVMFQRNEYFRQVLVLRSVEVQERTRIDQSSAVRGLNGMFI